MADGGVLDGPADHTDASAEDAGISATPTPFEVIAIEDRPIITFDLYKNEVVYSVWGDPGSIRRAPADGSRPATDFLTGVRGAHQVVDGDLLFFDTEDRNAALPGRGAIVRASLITGTTSTVCGSWFGGEPGRRMIVAADDLYWLEDSSIRKAPKDGDQVAPGFLLNLLDNSTIGALAVEGPNMLWTASTSIQRTPLSGQELSEVILTTDRWVVYPYEIAVDETSIYYVRMSRLERIGREPGSTPALIASDVARDFVLAGDTAYYSKYAPNRRDCIEGYVPVIGATKKVGGQEEIIFDARTLAPGSPQGEGCWRFVGPMSADETHVYFLATHRVAGGPEQFQILRTPRLERR